MISLAVGFYGGVLLGFGLGWIGFALLAAFRDDDPGPWRTL